MVLTSGRWYWGVSVCWRLVSGPGLGGGLGCEQDSGCVVRELWGFDLCLECEFGVAKVWVGSRWSGVAPGSVWWAGGDLWELGDGSVSTFHRCWGKSAVVLLFGMRVLRWVRLGFVGGC